MAALLSRVPRPTRIDLWLALGLLALSAGSTAVIEVVDPIPGDRDAWPWGYALILVACLPILWRTAFPRVVAAVTVTAATVYYPLSFPDGVVMLSAAVMLYTVVRWGYRVFGWLMGPGVFVALSVHGLLSGGSLRAESVATLAWIIVLLCAAEVVRWRQEYLKADQEREAEVARTREEELLRRASDERLRLARDVHDTVAHNISLINVQAGTALYLMESQPERAAEALSTIKQTSKDTLTELRAMLGVLRAVDESAPRSPVPGLDRVPDLVEGARGAGLEVVLEVTGEERRVAVGVEGVAYRAVQEALTNVVRHSDAGSARVRLDYGPSELLVAVVDDGRGTVGPPVEGNGITGMRERAALVGGSVDAGPVEGGGFRVRVRLPVDGGPAQGQGETG
ncbi:sensor histidine kinase [Nocardiopsis ganjiahuensis]|uniref:sensor histidine kinase n=1 Tax=Nocardiopsis ganjiahuensis TaxID=239984 RepID=UPI000344A512|nr:sensor histidine kinase [Nocardiopsis ganjiahuensis]